MFIYIYLLEVGMDVLSVVGEDSGGMGNVRQHLHLQHHTYTTLNSTHLSKEKGGLKGKQNTVLGMVCIMYVHHNERTGEV